ncbi:MAG: ATP-binding protein [Butyrivibrio sp.]|nr:ATP-binding protein [Butyrivibrio sp.]
MKLLKLTFDGLPHFKDILDIDFVAKQRVGEEDKEQLCNVFSNVYVNKAISFIGINASGKTTILRAISFAIKMLNNESINNIKSKEILVGLENDKRLIITSYFSDDSSLYKLETFIKKEINSIDGNEKFIIFNELLWSKDFGRVKTKKGLFDFQDSDLLEQRNQNERYLMEDISIIAAVNKKNEDTFYVQDMLEWTDHNMLNVLGRFPKELLNFLDSGIERLEGSVDGKNVDIRLKFYGKEEMVLNNIITLENYLSSGTIKGLGVFMSALFVFCEGGYLVIDEIENHFNREIVATLIRFFLNPKVNKKGAVLLFSTHYSELLDEFERNDSIYIVRNREGIHAQNLSDILKRNDIKKSDVYNSDYLGGTVPAYDAYMKLKKVLTGANVMEEL